jgi:hypothetical protein
MPLTVGLTLICLAHLAGPLDAQPRPRKLRFQQEKFSVPTDEERKQEYEEAHAEYFSKIDRAASLYKPSLELDTRSDTNKPWRDFLALPKRIRKLVIKVDRNTNQYHAIALLTDRYQTPCSFEITSDYVCNQLMADLAQLPRAFGDAPVANKLGSIVIHYDDPLHTAHPSEFEIGISDTSFIMGDGAAGVAETSFYSWTLARVFADAARENGKHLTQLSFNILSGFNAHASPVRFNARLASANKRQFWRSPANIWYQIPNEFQMRRREPWPREISIDSWAVTSSAYLDVKSYNDESGDFHWFNREFLDEYWTRPMWLSDEQIYGLLNSRPTFIRPIEVHDCKILGVIIAQQFFGQKVNLFVTDKGFLSESNLQYQLFYSHDLAVWLDAIAQEHASDLSQKAFNILSGTDFIISAQAKYLGADTKSYDYGPAQAKFVLPLAFDRSTR